MNDPVFEAFLKRQYEEAVKLAQRSDLVELQPFAGTGSAVTKYVARFLCNGVVQDAAGEIVPAGEFHVGIWFHPGYLRRVEPSRVLTLLHPERAWHPNVRWPHICGGHLPPGTPLVSILYQVYEILSYHLWSPHDALNATAAQWARNNAHRFPLDRRPLLKPAVSRKEGRPTGARGSEHAPAGRAPSAIQPSTRPSGSRHETKE